MAIGRGSKDSTLAAVFQKVPLTHYGRTIFLASQVGFVILAVAMFMMGCEMEAAAVSCICFCCLSSSGISI